MMGDLDLDKLRSIGYLSRGRTRNRVVEKRASEQEGGYRIKETTDEAHNTVTEHAKGDRQDVLIRADPIKVSLDVNPQ